MADRNSIFMKADEVQEFLGVSRTESYRIIKQLNEELKASGYMIITGRVSRKYLEEKVYGYIGSAKVDRATNECEIPQEV